MTKARDNSQKLREAEAAYNDQRPVGRTRQMSAATRDSLTADNMDGDDETTDANALFERMLAQARPSERPKMLEMTPAQRRELVTLARSQSDEPLIR